MITLISKIGETRCASPSGGQALASLCCAQRVFPLEEKS
jgi:hypothetical protein